MRKKIMRNSRKAKGQKLTITQEHEIPRACIKSSTARVVNVGQRHDCDMQCLITRYYYVVRRANQVYEEEYVPGFRAGLPLPS